MLPLRSIPKCAGNLLSFMKVAQIPFRSLSRLLVIWRINPSGPTLKGSKGLEVTCIHLANGHLAIASLLLVIPDSDFGVPIVTVENKYTDCRVNGQDVFTDILTENLR